MSETQNELTSNTFTMQDTINDKKGRIACPRSWDNASLLTDFEIHFEDPDKLINGICRKCHAKLMKTHKGFLRGKIETPVDLNEHRHEPDLQQDHAAFDAPGDLVGVVDFPFEEIDGVLESAPEDARQLAGEVIRQVFAYCFSKKGSLTAAAAKFAVIGAGLRPDVLSDATQTDLAKRLGLTKAALSKASVRFQDTFGIKFSRSRNESARAKMRARRLGGPDRHHQATTGVPS
jgi:hypothetical protein